MKARLTLIVETRKMFSPINEETIVPEEKQVEDAIVTDEVKEVEPVEADAVVTEETDETDNGEAEASAEEAGEPEDPSPPKKDGTQKRIDEITREKHDARREAEYWKKQAQDNQVAPEPVEPGKTLADFEYDEGKFTEYLSNQAKADAQAETDKVVAQERDARLHADFSGRENEFSKDVDDYHTATTSDSLQFSADMRDATLTADEGPALRYYLAKNPEVSAKLSKMAPYDMAMELGKIAATKLGKKEKPSVTKAPKPVPKIAGTDSKQALRIDDPKISDAQFRKLREKQIANR